jgi:hypothetical protein
MPQYLLGLGFITFTALVVILGDYVLKLAADRGHGTLSVAVALGVLLYGASALLWFAAMRHVTLATGGRRLFHAYAGRPGRSSGRSSSASAWAFARSPGSDAP